MFLVIFLHNHSAIIIIVGILFRHVRNFFNVQKRGLLPELRGGYLIRAMPKIKHLFSGCVAQ